MKTSHTFAAIFAAMCLLVTPSIGFQQQPLRPLSSVQLASSSSAPKHFSRFGKTRQQKDQLVWWTSNQQKRNGPLMADIAASADGGKKGFFGKVCIRLASVFLWNCLFSFFGVLGNVKGHSIRPFFAHPLLHYWNKTNNVGQIDRPTWRGTQKVDPPRLDVLCYFVQLHHLARH